MSLPKSADREATSTVEVEVEVLATSGTGGVRLPRDVRTMTLSPGESRAAEFAVGPGTLKLEARAPGYWSPPVAFRFPDDARVVALRLWRTAPLAVVLAPTLRSEAVRDVLINFRASPVGGEAKPGTSPWRGNSVDPAVDLVPEGSRKARSEGDVLTCEIPVGVLDLRIEVRDHVPLYLWSHRMPANGVRLGPIKLQRGASVTGYVQTEAGARAGDATVELLTPTGARIRGAARGRNAQDADHSVTYPLQARTNARGFFQIVGMAPGEFEVSARKGDLIAQSPVRVEPDLESRLADFLSLEEPMQLQVSVDPATPPDTRPGDGTPGNPQVQEWTIKAMRLDPAPGEVRASRAGAAGTAVLAPIGRGRYSIEVWNGAERWFLQSVVVDQPPGPLLVRIPVTNVRGDLSLGGRPLSGKLVFGGRGGPREITIETDTEGRFAGVLPNPGAWAVKVESENPSLHRTIRRVLVEPGDGNEAYVRLDLPGTSLSGSVVDAKGIPVPRALLIVQPHSGDDDLFQIQTDHDGTFALNGLPAGSLTLLAQGQGGEASEVTTVSLLEDAPQEVRLVLATPVPIRGRVRSASGAPIAGATVLAFPWGKAWTASLLYSTDLAGEFTASLPAGTTEVALRYWADGYAEQFHRLPAARVPFDLTLDREGGTVILDFGREVDLWNHTTSLPVVVRAGVAAAAGSLLMDALRRGVTLGGESVRSELRLPQMAPGEYRLCSQDLPGIRSGGHREVRAATARWTRAEN